MSRLAPLPVSLPSVPISEDTEAAEVAAAYGNIFANIQEQSFLDDAVWRDTYALTGTMRTFYGAKGVSAAWRECIAQARPHSFHAAVEQSQLRRLPGGHSWVDVPFTFETASEPPLLCTASLWLAKDDSDRDGWKIWVMTTVLDRIKGLPSVDDYSAATPGHQTNGSINGTIHNVNGIHSENSHFDCIIVGGGQAGLNVAARCMALGISYVILEKNKAIGDNWKNRYDSARLHTIKDYTHFPFERTWTEEYGQWLSKDDLAKGYDIWARNLGVNVWCSTELLDGTWDEATRSWTLKIRRQENDVEEEVTSSFVIMAVGAGGQIPHMPALPGRDQFKGIIQHSDKYKSASGWAGMKAVVVGTANTAHDIAEDMLDAGCSTVTMVQRSDTFVLPTEWYEKVQERTYNAKVPIHVADRLGQSNPNAVQRLVVMTPIHAMIRQNIGRFEALQKAGFRVDVFGDPIWHLFERLGGHYMDVGASKKIADGLIKIKSDAALTHYTPNGLGFADGSELPADCVVFATGFETNLRHRVQQLFGKAVADQVGDFSRMDDEGEQSGAFRFRHPGLACSGGAIGPCRWFSRFLAMHMKAELMGTPMQVFSRTPVPPTRTDT